MDRARVRHREAVAVELRLQGYTYQQIADICEFSHRSSARKAVWRALTRRVDAVAEQYALKRLAEIDTTEGALWPAARAGSTDASERILNGMDERHRLLGWR